MTEAPDAFARASDVENEVLELEIGKWELEPSLHLSAGSTLVGLEYIARRAPHARVLTAIVAFAPMALWELTQSSGDTSGQGAVLGVTAVLFAVLARLPARFQGRSTEDRGAVQPPAGTAIAPR